MTKIPDASALLKITVFSLFSQQDPIPAAVIRLITFSSCSWTTSEESNEISHPSLSEEQLKAMNSALFLLWICTRALRHAELLFNFLDNNFSGHSTLRFRSSDANHRSLGVSPLLH